MEAQEREAAPAAASTAKTAAASAREKREAIVLRTILTKAGNEWASATPRQKRNHLLSGALLAGAEDRLLSAPDSLSNEQRKLIVDSLANAARKSEVVADKPHQGHSVGQRVFIIAAAALSVAAVVWTAVPDFVKHSMEAALNKDVPPELIAAAQNPGEPRKRGQQRVRGRTAAPETASAEKGAPPAQPAPTGSPDDVVPATPSGIATGPLIATAAPHLAPVAQTNAPELPPLIRERNALRARMAWYAEAIGESKSQSDGKRIASLAVDAVRAVGGAGEGVADAETAATAVTWVFDAIAKERRTDVLCEHADRGSCRLGLRMVDDYDLAVVATGSGRTLGTLIGHDGDLTASVVSLDERIALSGSRDRTARIWTLAGFRPAAILRGHDDDVTAVALSRDARLAATGSADRTVRIWDTASGRELAVYKGAQGTVLSVEFSQDGHYLLAVSSDGMARRWDLRGELPAVALGVSGSSILATRMSADASRIAALSQAATLQIWSTGKAAEVAYVKPPMGMVRNFSFSPDGRYLATVTWEGSVALWDADDGRFVAPIASGDARIESVAVGAAGAEIRALTRDGAVLTYPMLVNLSDALGRARHVAGDCGGSDIGCQTSGQQTIDGIVARIWRVYDGGTGAAPELRTVSAD